jgi:hypothetical protein
MRVFFPKSLLDGLTSDQAILYARFYATHIFIKISQSLNTKVEILSRLPQAPTSDVYSWQVSENPHSIILETVNYENLSYDCHVSDSLWGTWWHNGRYPTVDSSTSSRTKILSLPLTFGMGSKSIDLFSRRVAATENVPLISSASKASTSDISSLSTYVSNQVATYSLDIASSLSFGGYRFTNAEYRHALSQRESSTFTIAVIGGSAAFCDCSPDSLAFPSLLEGFLRLITPTVEYKVFNFGQIGATLSSLIPTVVNEILPIRPNLIISYTGYNEIRNCLGQYTDLGLSPNALPHAHSGYVNREFYMQHAGEEYMSYQLNTINCSRILNAIMENHKVHHSLAKHISADYLAVLQPISYLNIPFMNPLERSVFNFYSTSADLKVSYQKILHGLHQLWLLLSKSDIEVVNMQDLDILRADRSDQLPLATLFHDTMHQTFSLEPFIAIRILETIIRRPISTTELMQIQDCYQFPFSLL